MTRSFDVFYDLHLNKRLSKQSWGWWFETPLRPLWRHCNVLPGDFGGARQQLQSGEAIVAIVIGLLVLLGLVGNIVSFLTFGKMPKNATTFLLCSLAVIDSSFLLLTAIPFAMKPYAVQWVGCCDLSFRFITNFFKASSRIACMAVVWTSVITGMNCYIVVCPPHQAARLCTPSRARKQLLWTVLFSIVYALPRVFRYKSTKMSKAWQKYFYVIGCKMAFRLAIPFAMLLFFFSVWIIATLTQARRSHWVCMEDAMWTAESPLILVTIILVFLICNSPNFIYDILRIIWITSSWEHGLLSTTGGMLLILISSCNWVIYFAYIQEYRMKQCERCTQDREPSRNYKLQ